MLEGEREFAEDRALKTAILSFPSANFAPPVVSGRVYVIYIFYSVVDPRR